MRSDQQIVKFFRENSGAAAVEFGFVASLLCFLFVGLADFGMGYWKKMQVGNAARAGAQYAMKNGWSSSGISTAITSATSFGSIAASPAPTQACGCPNASSGIVATSCGASCTGGGTAGTYVTANATASYSPLLPYPGIASTFTFVATNTLQIN